MRQQRRGPGATAALPLAALLFACGGPAQLRYEERAEAAPAAARHAVHDARLRERMRELDALRTERLPQAMDLESERRRHRAEVVRVARAMQQSARRLAEAPPAALGGEAHAEFLGLAAELEARAGALASAAEADEPVGLRARMRELDATCDACHARFRAPGGPRGGD